MADTGNTAETQTDAALVKLARAGDREVFDRLIEKYGPGARRLAARFIRRQHLAEDIAQEATLQAWLSINKLHDPSRFKNWLYGIVVNICRGYLRERRDTSFSLDAILEGLHPSSLVSFETPQQIVEKKESNQTIFDSIMSLNPTDRDVLLFFYWAELRVNEIAGLQGKIPGTVRVNLLRARTRLKSFLLENYPELAPVTKRRKVMITITVADVIRQEYLGKDGKPVYVLLLLDKAGNNVLPIWIAEREAEVIAMGLREFSTLRPGTHDFFLEFLSAIKGKIEEVRIQSLKGKTFYAVVKTSVGKAVSEMDARPSDAVALAVMTGCPIYVAEDVMEREGITVPSGIQSDGHGIDVILEERKKVQLLFRNGPWPSKAEIQKMKEDILKEAFK